MKQWSTLHNNIPYTFEFIESVKVIDVIKGGVPTYVMRWNSRLCRFNCNCPGARYHGKCWHTEVVPFILCAPDVSGYIGDIVEMAGEERCLR